MLGPQGQELQAKMFPMRLLPRSECARRIQWYQADGIAGVVGDAEPSPSNNRAATKRICRGNQHPEHVLAAIVKSTHDDTHLPAKQPTARSRSLSLGASRRVAQRPANSFVGSYPAIDLQLACEHCLCLPVRRREGGGERADRLSKPRLRSRMSKPLPTSFCPLRLDRP